MAAATVARSFEYWFFQYKRTWRSTVFSTVLTPVLYLGALGVGLGSLVNRSAGAAQLGGASYLAFLAPGVLAATAMQVAAVESTFPVMSARKWLKTYHAMTASPLGVLDVALGHLAWMAARVGLAAVAFLAAMALFGLVHTPAALLTVVFAVLVGVSFAAPIAALAVTQENDAWFSTLQRFVIMPLFLFSGVFFPLSRLPELLHPVAYAMPLWHGIELCRGAVLGTWPAGWMTLLHVAYLCLWAGAGTALAARMYRKALIK